MPTTRSMRSLSALASSAAPSVATTPSRSPRKSKRKAQDMDTTESPSPSQSVKKTRVLPSSASGLGFPTLPPVGANQLLPAVLSFSFEDAKQHLIDADPRFKGVFSKLPCRPFEHLERVDPFRVHLLEREIGSHETVRGQQISWLAARSITHKFIRLYDPSLPEKPPPLGANAEKSPQEFFPTASQVASTDTTTLKSAGLSTRKAEYVQDLASRFADGRLTNEKLVEADDEELARLLIEVRGIGRWTVDMFAMFSLRRPDILPVGDLGVQRGVIRWFLSLHSPANPITISPKKLPKAPGNVSDDQDTSPQGNTTSASVPNKHIDSIAQADPSVPVPGSLPSTSLASGEPDVSSLPPVPVTPVKGKTKAIRSPQDGETLSASPDKVGLETGSMPMLPEPFTPSINKTLNPGTENGMDVDAADGTEVGKKAIAHLPEGLTVASLKGRLTGKKIKGALLTPKEMEELTEPWRPYRSLGVYYMWALAEETT